jgi:hypothetical protein
VGKVTAPEKASPDQDYYGTYIDENREEEHKSELTLGRNARY